jgi:hypothetical protein
VNGRHASRNGTFFLVLRSGASKLRQELEVLWSANRAGGGLHGSPAEYLEVIGIRV